MKSTENIKTNHGKILNRAAAKKTAADGGIMITPAEIARVTMTEEKKKSAKNDYFAFYIGRPITYVMTIPLLYTNISPNAVSVISIIPVVISFLLLALGKSTAVLAWGWFSFFFWSLLDGVDGNIARYKKQFSAKGDVLDALSGYTAMALGFFGAGIAAQHNPGQLTALLGLPPEIYTVLGGLSGMAMLLPRLTLHKAINSMGKEKTAGIKDKSSYGPIKIIALNITSISSGVQLFMLAAVLLGMLDAYTLAYFAINMLVMVVSIISIFKD